MSINTIVSKQYYRRRNSSSLLAITAVLLGRSSSFAFQQQQQHPASSFSRAGQRFLSSANNNNDNDNHHDENLLGSLRIPELKDRLRSAGLKVGGRKAELIERLQLHYTTTTGDSVPNSSIMPKRKTKSKKAGADASKKKEEKVVEPKNDTTTPDDKEESPPPTKKKKTTKAADHQRQTERTEIPKLWNPSKSSESSTTFKIASWNVAGLRALLRNHPDALPKLCKDHDLDVLCLQETKLQEMHVEDPKLEIGGILLNEEGYDGHYSCSTTKKGYSGTAVFIKRRVTATNNNGKSNSKDKKKDKKQTSLSSFFTTAKKKDSKTSTDDEKEVTNNNSANDDDENNNNNANLVPIEVSYGIGKTKHDGEGRAITVDFPLFTMTNLYVPNSGQKLERLSYRTKEWDKDLVEYMQRKEQDRPIIWLGDLNVAFAARDTWNEGAKHLAKNAGTTVEERTSFQQQLDCSEYIDAFAKLHPDALGHYTYWSQRAGNRQPNKGLRLDYYICSPQLFEEDNDAVIRDCYMLPDQMGSDHCPVVLEIEIKKK